MEPAGTRGPSTRSLWWAETGRAPRQLAPRRRPEWGRSAGLAEPGSGRSGVASLLSQEGPGSAGWPWGTSGRQRVGLGPGKWRGITRVSVGRVRAIL